MSLSFIEFGKNDKWRLFWKFWIIFSWLNDDIFYCNLSNWQHEYIFFYNSLVLKFQITSTTFFNWIRITHLLCLMIQQIITFNSITFPIILKICSFIFSKVDHLSFILWNLLHNVLDIINIRKKICLWFYFLIILLFHMLRPYK